MSKRSARSRRRRRPATDYVLRFWIASHQVDQRRQRELQLRISDLEARIEALQRQLQALTDIEREVEPGP